MAGAGASAGWPAAHGEEYPRFSDDEIARRWAAAAAALERAGADALLAYGADRAGAAVQWLSEWPVTREAALVWFPGDGPPLLWVQFANHVDNAARLASGCEVRWGGESTAATVADELRARRRGGLRLGVVGPLPARAAGELEGAGAALVFCDRELQRLRVVKSDEELDWVRRGAALTDAAVEAMARHAHAGTSEAELGAIVERAYAGQGGTTHIHYFGATSMDRPAMRVPAQWPATRRLRPGDALFCEVSASWWGYPGQLLRTFTVEEPPNPLFRELHDVATDAFEVVAAKVAPGTTGAELAAAAARVVEGAGLATCDDVVHGFVGGYLPPVVPGGGRPGRHDAFVLEAGMTLVVQPNVTTPDGTAGVQTGELLLVTAGGYERLHAYPPGLGLLGR
ncbi:MAG TPA: M24 family metallopeptidase [Acidimicrobiales bacterium]|nr:M24 family metallopeptidase [Acidimicrobiales bacterium]